MRAEHDKLQEEYSQQELLGGAASLGLQKGVDDLAIATNQKYMDETKKAADELATKGFIDSGRRRNLMGLKQQYTQNVLPIQNALKERDAAIKMDREMKMKDSSYISQFDPSKRAVTDYLTDNNAFSARGVSGQEVYKDAAQALSTLKDVATSELPALRGAGITDKYFTIMKQGLSPEQAAALMQKQSRSQAESESWSKLAKMTVSAIDGAMQRHGVYDVFKDNPKMIDKFWQDTSKAAIFAVGTPKIGEMTDEMSLYRRKKALDEPKTPAGLGLGDPIQITTDEGKRLIGGEEFKNVRFGSNGSVIPKIGMGSDSETIKKGEASARQMDLTIKNYAKARGITGKSSKEIFNLLSKDRQYLEDRAKLLNHNLRPIMNNMASNNIMGNAFSSNVGATKFVNFDSGSYTGDMSTGTNLESIAKSVGTTTAGITKYLRDNNIKPNFDETSGLYTVSIPSKLVKEKDNYYPGKDAKSMTIGFATQAGHQSAIEKIDVVRNARITGSQEQTRITKEPIRRVVDGVEYWQQDVYYPKEDKVYNIYYKTKYGAMNHNKKDVVHQAPMAGGDYTNNHLSNILNNTLNESENISELQDKPVNLTSGW